MAAQLVAVLLLFALFVVLPLPDSFFSDYGLIVGPLSWVACSFAAGRVVSLAPGRTLAAAAISGVIATLVALALTHAVGLLAGIIAFGVTAGASSERPAKKAPGETRPRGGVSRTGPPK